MFTHKNILQASQMKKKIQRILSTIDRRTKKYIAYGLYFIFYTYKDIGMYIYLSIYLSIYTLVPLSLYFCYHQATV